MWHGFFYYVCGLKQHEVIDEIKCITDLRGGSYKAFRLIYDEYADRLYAFVIRNLRNRTLAQDIVQDTFMRLWIHRKQLNSFGNIQGLLFAIAKYRLIDHFRQQMSQPEFVEYLSQSVYDRADDISPDDVVMYDEFVARLTVAKNHLTPRERGIYELSRERYMSVKDIAERLGLSEQTVKNHLTSALRILRDELSGLAVIFLFWL